ncbi:MAG: hypothetical protein DRP63_04845 [Planctomycetota bacterium]|nr:MAG: hypothetical protein DRP63_04845 [Planctomycetota bacterium]
MRWAVVLALLCVGCVAVEQFEALKEEKERIEENLRDAKEEIRQLETKNEVLRQRLAGKEAEIRATQEMLNELKQEAAKKPEETIKPEGWRINPATGGIVLEAKILFPAASAEPTEKGKQVLSRLARLLNSPKYRKYLVRVDGHTDKMPVVKTKEKNIDNWFLSARRAHSVLVELKRLGVESERLFLCGWGPNRPIEPNDESGANPKNRRVEIVLLLPGKKEGAR